MFDVDVKLTNKSVGNFIYLDLLCKNNNQQNNDNYEQDCNHFISLFQLTIPLMIIGIEFYCLVSASLSIGFYHAYVCHVGRFHLYT